MLLGLCVFAAENKPPAGKQINAKDILLGNDADAMYSLEASLSKEHEGVVSDLVFVLENSPPRTGVAKGLLNNGEIVAADLLGQLRAEQAVKVLVDKIDGGRLIWGESHLDPFPCLSALVKIGKPASLACLERLATEKFVESEKGKLGRSELLLNVVRKVEGDDVARFMLQKAIEKEQDKDKKANLTAALALLEQWIKAEAERNKPQEGAKPVSFDQIQDKVVADFADQWAKTANKPENKDLDKLISGDRGLVETIEQCGRIRSVKAVPDLIKAITVVAPSKEPRPSSTLGQSPPLNELYPAWNALVKIGAPALPYLVAQFTGANQPKVDSQREYFLLEIIAAIAGPENGVRLFEKAISEAKAEADQKSLKGALEKFRNLRSIPIFVDDPPFQMFAGNVFETLSSSKDAPKGKPATGETSQAPKDTVPPAKP
jgi:hypothetical protein